LTRRKPGIPFIPAGVASELKGFDMGRDMEEIDKLAKMSSKLLAHLAAKMNIPEAVFSEGELISASNTERNSIEWILIYANILQKYIAESKNGDVFELREIIDWSTVYGYMLRSFEGFATGKVFDPVANGKKGGIKRHEKMTELQLFAIEKYRAGQWKSANQASHALKDSIIKHGRGMRAYLSEENAQRTIAEWFRKSA
jgi:hypothetical protein